MNLLVDVHAHLDFCNNLNKIISNAEKAGVKTIINNGLNPISNRKTLELSKKYKIVKAALGFHPTDALKLSAKELDNEINFIKNNKKNIIAIGEVGLDFLRSDEKENQINIFLKVIKLSNEIKKPLIIHSRKAEKEVVNILEKYSNTKIVLHCFNGKKELIKRAEKLGYYFSIPPILVRSQPFQELVRIVNINQLLTETDCPYMSPFPGKQNEPAFIIETIKKVSAIKGMDMLEVENNIFMNYREVFG